MDNMSCITIALIIVAGVFAACVLVSYLAIIDVPRQLNMRKEKKQMSGIFERRALLPRHQRTRKK